jgi:hypothetical protein
MENHSSWHAVRLHRIGCQTEPHAGNVRLVRSLCVPLGFISRTRRSIRRDIFDRFLRAPPTRNGDEGLLMLPKKLGVASCHEGSHWRWTDCTLHKAPRASKALSSHIMFPDREAAALPNPLSSCTVEQEPTGRPMLVNAVTATDAEYLNET